MNCSELRNRSRQKVEMLGYTFNPNLPILDDVEIGRSCKDIVDRILAMYACVSCAHGFAKNEGFKWVENEGLSPALTSFEVRFLTTKEKDRETIAEFQWQVEAMWALTWAAQYHSELNWEVDCSSNFVKMFPDIRIHESSKEFRIKCRLRETELIAEAVDLAYCIHWALVDQGRRERVNEKERIQRLLRVRNRRQALEWLVGKEAWEDISLDT